ncbi:D-alanyl-D-alanine carboxypeptidase [Streptococcus iniae]|uniref:D-alanyl-D-alanine carboxypeptidase PBP3 n=1 Tax=Streptococcus iniae TaxID=1346 RepID=UPI0008DB0737|nr:D-alanyl-D-alanine carboxypeptidase PBP3 [Streptococcus iniae]OHX26663.1 D-alanyl-D-alanine carboxypeptidase [Streptococcus iniae]RLV28371.1 D-alanyl-D-alanine carboxypeptidase [Streptococcus iniae]
MKKLIISLLLCFICLPLKTVSAEALKIKADSTLVYDVTSGKILYESHAKEKVPVASLSKALTAYLVYKAVDNKKIKWNTPVKISNYPYELTANYDISNVPLDAREYTVEELLEAMLVTNANSAAIALAEKISGTEPLFVDLMKKQLKEWGINQNTVVNATGLPNSILGSNRYPKSKEDAENLFSALDLAIVSRHLLQEYPQVLKLTNKATTTFSGTSIYSYNYMLKGMPFERPGINGLFVGYSEKNGASFMASSKQNKMHLVTIILNAKSTDTDEFPHFKATNQLLNHIYSHFEKKALISKGSKLSGKTLTVADSPQKEVSLTAKETLYIVQKKGEDTSDSIEVRPLHKQVTAPVKAKQTLAKASFKDKAIIGTGYLGETPSVELVSKDDIKKSFFLKVWWNHFVNYVNEEL